MERSNGNDFTQHVTSNGIGHQNYYSGRGHQIITGNGTIHNYNAAYPDIENSRQKIMQALCTSPYLQRKNRNPDRVPGTCEWFMNHHDFHHWRDNTSSSMLWVSANPGCGKSVLAKYLVNELKTTEQRTTCYFFFKDDFEDQRSAKGALSCILHQLFTQRENLLSTKIMNRFKSYRTPLANSYYELWQLWDILIMTAREKSAGQIICILDAFDECVNQERQDLATILREFYGPNGDTKGSVNLKFLITGRPYDRIRQDLIRPFNIQDCPVIHLKGEGDAEVEKIAEEIGLYIKDKISRIRANLDLTQKEEDILLQGLEAIPHQTYLWVYLTLEWIETEINNKISEAEIRKAISTLPRTVDEAYDKILAMSTDVKETKKLLHIVVAAERPLTLEEMDLALEIEQHHKSYKDLALKPSDRVKKYIRDLCGLFINITDEKIYLLHQTAKEFLVPSNNLYGEEYNLAQREDVSQGNNGNGLSWKFSLIPSESHRILFNICVWHLLFKEFEFRPLEEAADASKYLRGHLFLGYSANNWATHFRASNITEEKVRSQLQRLCTVISDCYPSWFGIYWANIHNDLPSGFTTLMIASYFGIETVVRRQLETANVEIDSTDGIYRRTALSFASENGFDSIVRLLIKGPKFDAKKAVKNAIRLSFTRGADINQTDRDGRTALSYAVWNGHLAIVKRLLKARARADKKDTIGGTPISYALCYGQEDIANELMRGAQPTSIDDIRRGLFVSAVKKGHEPVVKRLLDSGADTTMLINASAAVLSDAVEGRYDNIVRMLLARGVDVNHGYINDRVPLSIAIQFDENEHMIEMLLKGGAKMDYTFRVNNDFTTPLIFAVRQSNDRLVDLLVKYGADTTFRGHSESTPRGIAERMKMELTERLRSDAVWRGFNENDIYGENDSRDGNVASNISDRVQLQRRYAIVRMLEDKR